MLDNFNLTKKPEIDEAYLIFGFRQWVDGGSLSSELPRYLIKELNAEKIGALDSGNFYLFQLPVTQDLFRPMIKHDDGFPTSLKLPQNELYYAELNGKGVFIFLGDEPHMNVEGYVQNLLDLCKIFNIKRASVFGGIYAEVPYQTHRYITSIYSQRYMKKELESYSVDFSNYQGGGSIGSVLIQRASEQEIEMVGFYAFCPIFRPAHPDAANATIHLPRDYRAWLDVMQRIDHMFQLGFDLNGLEEQAQRQLDEISERIEELDSQYPEANIAAHFDKLEAQFDAPEFISLEDIWQDELNKLGGTFFGGENPEETE